MMKFYRLRISWTNDHRYDKRNKEGKGYYESLNQRHKYEKGPVYHQWNIDTIYIGIDSSNDIIHHVA